MEILTLLKANIRRKKGTFISIMLLTMIIVTIITAVFSVRDNYENALDNALEYVDSGEINTFIRTDRLTDELLSSVENSSLVEKAECTKTLATNGIDIGDMSDGNSHFMIEMTDKIRLFNSREDGFEESVPQLESGEIYLPLGLKYELECDVGDTATVYFIGNNSAEFKIKGFVQEPYLGSMIIGIKYIFICHEDFQKYYDLCKPLETDEEFVDITAVQIHQAEDCELSVAKFQRELNKETKIVDHAWVTLNEEQSKNYTTLMPDMLLDIVLVFAILLFVTVLIVMSHSIGTEIEIDYATLGVLKSQGFTKGKIRAVIMLQYVIAEVIGILLGSIAAFPMERVISGLFLYVTAVLPDSGISAGKTLIFTAVILSASVILIFIKTGKIAKISPVRAISGGREEIYFTSRLNAPISKKLLSASLSLRQFTSAKKRYIGAVFITAILTFCMITIELTGIMISSQNALNMMGLTFADLSVFIKEGAGSLDDVDEIVNDHTEIERKNSSRWEYMSLNGDNLQCEMHEFPEYIGGILKGRAPIYDNEILITEMVADALDIKMGDEVTVSSDGIEERYVISGIYQSAADAGMSFAMSFEAAEKLGMDTKTNYRYYIVEDKSQINAISDDIKAKYGDNAVLGIVDIEEDPEMELYNMIISILKIVIYVFSIIFAFVVVRLVCSKTFIQERTDIGIYKAIGFTSKRLRSGFAIRFLIIAVLGSIFGAVLSLLFSEKILSLLFGLMGLSKVVLEYTAASILVPVFAICLSFFVFAYLVSRRVKKVAVRELVVE
ncbi:MAG: FtsX-like permease family protein [Oscillospiraceae bacterium]